MKTFLIVEDEEFAMEDLRDSLLSINPSLDIHSAQNATEALEKLGERRFDGMFLDIELPGMSGLDILKKTPTPVPPTVLVTAHAIHALEGFGLGVLDCLLKPIDIDRLRQSYELILQHHSQDQNEQTPPPPAPTPAGRRIGGDFPVFLRMGGHVLFIKAGEIQRLEWDGERTHVYSSRGMGSSAKSLREIETLLDPACFFRAGDSDIVNLHQVHRIQNGAPGQLVAIFADGTEIPFSAEQSRAFENTYGL